MRTMSSDDDGDGLPDDFERQLADSFGTPVSNGDKGGILGKIKDALT